MVLEKKTESLLWPPFSFTVPSERVRFIQLQLLRGFSVAVDPVDIDQSTGFLARIYDPKVWSMDEIMDLAVDQSRLGMNELHGLGAQMLGGVNRETLLIDETLVAGFTVYLFADVSTDGRVVGSYILRASITDNS